MTKIIELIKYGLIALALLVVGFQYVGAYQTQIRNQAFDGCAAQTFYQNEFDDAEGRHITNREPQKTLYEKCLIDKGIKAGK
ncbi:MAG: hypothetical protein WCT01_04160 [Candidatus Shapirobacteria bacterium]|jgi:hypothetical protein